MIWVLVLEKTKATLGNTFCRAENLVDTEHRLLGPRIQRELHPNLTFPISSGYASIIYSKDSNTLSEVPVAV